MTGPRIPTPEALQRWSRWMDAWHDAYNAAKASADWTSCTCDLCQQKRHIAIQRHMPAELQ